MSRIVFQKAEGRLPHPKYGMHHGRDFIRCDLARPTAELEAIAVLVSSLPWTEDAMVLDATLYVGSDYRVPYPLQERALHGALEVARQVLAEGLAAMPGEIAKPSPRPEPSDSTYCSRPSTYVRDENGRTSTKYAMPEGCYQPGMLMVERSGRTEVHFLVSNSYDGTQKELATPLLAMLAPAAGVEHAGRDGYADAYVRHAVDGIEEIGAACVRMAGGMIAAMKDRMRKQQHEGRPSAFTDEDNDARDALLASMAAGATIVRLPREDRDDADSRFDYVLDDGSELAAHVVERLLRIDRVVPEDGRWGRSSRLVAAEGITRADLTPRADAVSFDMFQSACRFRRHPDDGERECVCPSHNGYNSYCTSEQCPLLDRVYEAECGDLTRPCAIEDDPAFEYHDLYERPDPMMRARHPGTKRSYAWKAAGESRMLGVVNQVLGAHFTYGIPMLVEAMHETAVDEAVAKGWLSVDSRNALGSVTRVTGRLLAEVARQRQEGEAPVDA
jgi:hypothetical protein